MQQFRSYSDWEMVEALGEGAFGQVHRWRHTITRQEMATKMLKPNARLRPEELEIFKKRWIQEYNWMQSLGTLYIVGTVKLDKEFMQYLQSQHFYKQLPVIFMEYCNGGDLRSQLEMEEHINGLHEQNVRDVLRTLRHAVEYLHNECNIEHRDIKPENIVIHRSDTGTIYKLTDFGYAREIPENTVAQSVVGTRHYVAPEVIDPGQYNNTVDYWSVGIVIFELICGVRPFLPLKDFRIILENVLNKPKDCIAITESEHGNNFQFHDKVFAQNRCNPIFIGKIEKWLKLALDRDYNTRGSDQGVLKFYTSIDDILDTKIIGIFSLNTYEYFYYDISCFRDLKEFFETISRDTRIPTTEMYMTLPTSHPIKSIEQAKVPSDFYVADWCDTSDPDNPPVMLYVSNVTIRQCDRNVYKNFTTIIEECIKVDKNKYHKVPIWLLEKLERHIHYLLSEEKRYLDCYTNGLHEHAISIEEEVFHFKSAITKIYEDTLVLSGRIEQFDATIQKCQSNKDWLDKAIYYNTICCKLRNNVATKIRERYDSVFRHCKELANNSVFKSLPKEDIYGVLKFRKILKEARTNKMTKNEDRMTKCLQYFDNWASKASSWPYDIATIHKEIVVQYELFRKIKESVKQSQGLMAKYKNELEMETENLVKCLRYDFKAEQLSQQMDTLCMADSSSMPNGTLPFSLMNGHGDIDSEYGSVDKLIENTENLTQLISKVWQDGGDDENSSMSIDENTANIPTTIGEL
ncbi:inhibitor of nuclear factor kappa-B kinase subunit beta-like [Haematobia irritans]|uniref:inhibitor of nuclear factor kappa-B kinase subunit beta-like n=1 Tax=Haematobia irritans TaxID=7368 RepID=UPI003F4FEF7B